MLPGSPVRFVTPAPLGFSQIGEPIRIPHASMIDSQRLRWACFDARSFATVFAYPEPGTSFCGKQTNGRKGTRSPFSPLALYGSGPAYAVKCLPRITASNPSGYVASGNCQYHSSVTFVF